MNKQNKCIRSLINFTVSIGNCLTYEGPECRTLLKNPLTGPIILRNNQGMALVHGAAPILRESFQHLPFQCAVPWSSTGSASVGLVDWSAVKSAQHDCWFS